VTKPGKQQISLDATPFYHCYSRCVRRAFLCGVDSHSGKSYEHRRQQIEDDLLRLASIFFIDVAAFAVRSNHYHLVLFVDQDECKSASAKDIVKRWHKLFTGPDISQRYIKGEFLEPHELEQLDTLILTWRKRLQDISWFMKVLNENVAKRANHEDDCTGHFWESRFKSQALLDEKAVLSCMTYIDLNPIRAGMANTPETSNHTSIQMRIKRWKNASDKSNTAEHDPEEHNNSLQPNKLLPFIGNYRQPMPKGIAFHLIDYFELVDWTGRAVLQGKGSIDNDTPKILQRLNISPEHWIELSTHFESRFKGIVGTTDSLKALCSLFGLSRNTNRSNSRLLFS